MKIYDILEKKKNGEELAEGEIAWLVQEYMSGRTAEYQMAAFLMAVCIQGLSERETLELTQAMRQSGEQLDPQELGDTVDKHSTGGVGDKTTLILVPALAALGARVMKMSGRGLGYTGGTIDKLESIPGFRTELVPDEAIEQVDTVGACIMAQSKRLAPADKRIYALRDLTATVDSLPLIASSIMSKKLAAGASAIVLDVTCGSGAFMKDPGQAETLARLMIRIGRASGRRMAALVTNMDEPLGRAIGNTLEVREAMEVLQGGGPEDVRAVTTALGAAMWKLYSGKEREECETEFAAVLRSGAAWDRFRLLIQKQGGDLAALVEPKKPAAVLTVWEDGYIDHMDTEALGKAAMFLGAGREQLGDRIDPQAGLYLYHKTGEKVRHGEPMIALFTDKTERIPEILALLRQSVFITREKPEGKPLVYKVLGEAED